MATLKIGKPRRKSKPVSKSGDLPMPKENLRHSILTAIWLTPGERGALRRLLEEAKFFSNKWPDELETLRIKAIE